MKALGKIIVLIIAILIIFSLTSNVLFLAEDTSESVQEPGVDMAAYWSLGTGFQWIYPGSSTNAEGNTLHNVFLFSSENPYQGAKEIMQYSYNITPNICVTINNNASDRIFGSDMIDDIRTKNWGEGNDRGDAVNAAMAEHPANPIGVIESILLGDIRIFPI